MSKPSVTKLTAMLDKPKLLDWANKLGLSGITLSSARKLNFTKGTSIHKEIEMFLKNGECFSNKETQKKAEKLFNQFNIIGVEVSVENKYFKGRYDIKIEKGGIEYICDFKTGHKRHYLENYLQLSAYRMADDCDRVAIISVPEFTMFDLGIEDYEPYEQIMINLSNIYNIKELL